MANSLISTTPPQFDDAPARNAFKYLEIVHVARNLKLLTYISSSGSMGIFLLFFTQLLLKVKRSESGSAS